MGINLASIFEPGRNADPLPEAEELDLIERARNGEDAATERLLANYAPALRHIVGRATEAARSRGEEPDVHDLRSRALLGFMETVHAARGRLAQTINPRLREAVLGADTEFTLPPTTRKRMFAILREAGGDEVLAETLAPDFGMTAASFRDALAAYRQTTSLSGLEQEPPASDRAHAAVEDAVLVSIAFDAVNDLERKVVRIRYGFEDYDQEIGEREVAARLGITRHRVREEHSSALVKMRAALGA